MKIKLQSHHVLLTVTTYILVFLVDLSSEDHVPDRYNWVLPDACATVGKVFRYQIPRLESESNAIQYQVTEAGSNKLPSWLQFNSSTHTLQGVPMVQDEGYMYISITAHSKTELPHKSITDVFSIDVRLQNMHLDYWSTSLTLKAKPVENTKHDADFRQRTKCRPDQALYTASLVFNIKTETMKGSERVSLVENFADFASKNLDDLRLSARRSATVSRLMDSDVLAAGPGNVNSTNMYSNGVNRGVELTWPLACGGFPKLTDFIRVISHNIEVGTISNVTGYNVVGWYVTREQPLIRRQKINVDRIKRQAPGNMATPILTPTVTSTIPTAYVSTSTLRATSSQQVPARTSMITFTITPSTTSSFAPVVATSSEFPFPLSSSLPVFSPLPSPIATESMHLSTSFSSSDFARMSSSYTFPTTSSLLFPTSGIQGRTSTEIPASSYTMSSHDIQASSLQLSSQRLFTTVSPSSTQAVTPVSSFTSVATSYISSTSFPSGMPSISISRLDTIDTASTSIPSASLSISPSMTYTSVGPLSTSLLPSPILPSILPSSVSPTKISVLSSMLPTASYLSSFAQSTPMMSTSDTSTVVMVTPSMSGITAVLDSSVVISPTLTSVTDTQVLPSPSSTSMQSTERFTPSPASTKSISLVLADTDL